MSETIHIVVVGAAGFGRETLDVLAAIQASGAPITIDGVLDDSPTYANRERLLARSIPYLGGLNTWIPTRGHPTHFILGIGDPSIRARLARHLESQGHRAYTAVHPSAIIGSNVFFGEGTVVCAGAVLSTNVKLGRHTHINPNVTVGHDARVDDFVSLNPGAIVSGDVHIHDHVLIGAGAIVLQGLDVSSNVTVGAAALVTKNVPGGVTVTGVPGRWND